MFKKTIYPGDHSVQEMAFRGYDMLFFKIFILLSFVCITPVPAQDIHLIDSLGRLIQSAKEDTAKVNRMIDLAWELGESDPSRARQLLHAAVDLSTKLHFRKGEGEAYNAMGVVENLHGNYPFARDYYEKALAIRKSLKDRKGVASIYTNIGNALEAEGDQVGALQNYLEALRLAQELRDTQRMARTYYNISLVHENMANYTEALDYIYKYLELTEKTGDKEAIARAYNAIGNIKYGLDRYDEALESYENALKLHNELEDDWGRASILNNMGSVKDDHGEELSEKGDKPAALKMFSEALKFHEQALALRLKLDDTEGKAATFNNLGDDYKHLGQLEKALDYYTQSLRIRESIGEKKGIIEALNGIGDIKRRQNKLKEALDYTQRYYKLAQELQDQRFIQNGLKDFSRVYAEMGDFQKAYEYRKQYDEYRYARLDENRMKEYSRREALYGDFKKQIEIERQQQEIRLQNEKLQRASLMQYSLFGGAIFLTLLALLLYNRNRIKTRANEALAEKNLIIEAERKRSDELLLNILPAETAEELKTHGKTKARFYESVTVMFTDFRSFTFIGEQLVPEELVAELDICYQAFDEICTRHNVEKIKTIGDSYMCAGGLPTANQTHAYDVVMAALEMQAFMEMYKEKRHSEGRKPFEMRLGIHTGPVVAGIVGNKKFAYDIWGDTVNMAARMESSGEIGKVNISESTYEEVKEIFSCEYRGKIAAKNKGEVNMYFVSGIIGKEIEPVGHLLI